MPQESTKKRRHSVFFLPMVFVLVCAALIFVLGVFFRVGKIDVEGNRFYSAEEVAEAAGIAEGDNLFFINRFSAASKIFARLPYVEGVSIERELPNRLAIRVTESQAIACVETDNGLWAIDRTAKLLSKVDTADAAALIRIRGLTAVSPAEGNIVEAADGNTAAVEYLSDMLRQISALDLRQNITYIDMSSANSAVFDYLERFTVKMGPNDNTPYKFQLLIAAVSGLKNGDCGVLDLSIDSSAHLTYE